jgi:hypothetical protein
MPPDVTVQAPLSPNPRRPRVQRLVRRGDAGGLSAGSPGNAASTEDTTDLIAGAEERTGNVPIRLYVSGSKGATVSRNAMTHARLVPPCWYGVKPAVDLTTPINVPGADRIIREAFGGDVPADRNPVNRIGQMPTRTRYRMVTSPEDTWVRRAQNTGPLATGLKSHGADVTVLTRARHPRRPVALRRRRPARLRRELRRRGCLGQRHRQRC